MTSPNNQSTPKTPRGAVRRVFLPVVLLAAILVPSLSVLQSASLPELNYLLCQMSIIKTGEPASDAVFFGSSRTGAAIDAVAISESFDGTLETAEKVVFTLGSELDRDLGYRTYVKYRGVPRVLGIELSFERRGERLVEGESLLIPTGRTATLFESDVYAGYVGSLRDRQVASLQDTYVWSRIKSAGSFFFDRLGAGFDQAVRTPSKVFPPHDECSWKFKPRKGRWVVGNTKPFREAKATFPSQKKQAKWLANGAEWRSMDVDDSWTREELILLEDLVDTAYADGVETVILYYLPSFQEEPRVIDLDAVRARIPEAVIFDGRNVMLDESRPSLRYQYHDANHVNRRAAYEISVAIAEMAEEGVR